MKSWWFYFQNTQWTDIVSPLLQSPPRTNHHLIQTTAVASYVLAPLHPHSFFSIRWPQWPFKNQLGLKTLQRFPKDKILDLYCGLQGPTQPDPCLLIPTLLSLPPLTFPLICTGCLLAFAGTHQMCSHLMVFAFISPAWNVFFLDTCMTCPLLHLGPVQLFLLRVLPWPHYIKQLLLGRGGIN